MVSRSDAARVRGAKMREKNRMVHYNERLNNPMRAYTSMGIAFVKIVDQLSQATSKVETKRVKKEVIPEIEDDKKIHPHVWEMFDAARDLVESHDPDGILALYWLNEYMNNINETITPTPEIFKTKFPLEFYEYGNFGEKCCALIAIEKVYRMGVLKKDIKDKGFWK